MTVNYEGPLVAGIKITFPSSIPGQKYLELFSYLTYSDARGGARAGNNIPQARADTTAPWEKGLQVFEVIR